ncbi:MAG: hypothetical protein JW730_14235 [Anaerolineales bacterium]|nr:hypothetical protein [Anaerolineales bacterium]
MNTKNEISTEPGQINRPPAEAASAQEATPQTSAQPPKRTLTGFAKVWVGLWFLGNLGATCAPASYLSSSRLGGIVALFMLLAAIVAAGYLLLYYRNPIGLYLILVGNILAMLMNNIEVSGYTLNVQTGLIMGIITYFVTRKQVAYPFWKPAAAE